MPASEEIKGLIDRMVDERGKGFPKEPSEAEMKNFIDKEINERTLRDFPKQPTKEIYTYRYLTFPGTKSNIHGRVTCAICYLPDEDVTECAFAFYSPKEKRNFDKKIGREIALGRLKQYKMDKTRNSTPHCIHKKGAVITKNNLKRTLRHDAMDILHCEQCWEIIDPPEFAKKIAWELYRKEVL
jgi:hypothetical protein